MFLIGFMATGKSAVGKELAEILGRPFVDLDEEIEGRAGKTIAEIFADEGEDAFRASERQALEEVIARPPAVVATGGGTVLDSRNRARMAGSGTIVRLDAPPEVVLDRVGDPSSRPLLAGAEDRLGRIRELLAEREEAYRCANFAVDTHRRTVSEVAAEIADVLIGGRA